MIEIEITKLSGRAHKFGDHINTDYIIPGKYLLEILDSDELAKHVMEGVDPEFNEKVKEGDFIVAGDNFGCGSSREEAPSVIKHSGIKAVVAKSFARIFFRNAINIGLPVMECDTDLIEDGDELEINLEEGLVKNRANRQEIRAGGLPEAMTKILKDGGLVRHFKKHGSFAV